MNPRDDPHGGVAIIVRKSIQHHTINLNTVLQAVAVRACFEREITICSVYLPPRSGFSLNDIQTLVNQLPPPFLILGDFNSHNPLWGGNILDAKGRIIDDLIQNNKRIVTEEQSIFGRYSRVVLMKVILWYLSYLFQAAAIQENSYLRISTVNRIDPPEGRGIMKGRMHA